MQSAGILLIDDDRRLAEMVGRYLGQAGFSVQVQGTARAGPGWRRWSNVRRT